MSPRKKRRVSLGEPPHPTRGAPPPADAKAVGEVPALEKRADVVSGQREGVEREQPPAPDTASGTPAFERPGIEGKAYFWFILGALTVGIAVLLGLLLLPAASATPAAQTRGSAAVATATRAVLAAATATRGATATIQPDVIATMTAYAVADARVPRVILAETKSKLDAQTILLVDVRLKESFDEKHIKGAISIPEAAVEKRLTELPKDKEIILYCS